MLYVVSMFSVLITGSLYLANNVNSSRTSRYEVWYSAIFLFKSAEQPVPSFRLRLHGTLGIDLVQRLCAWNFHGFRDRII